METSGMIVIKNILTLFYIGRAGDESFVLQGSLDSTEIDVSSWKRNDILEPL